MPDLDETETVGPILGVKGRKSIWKKSHYQQNQRNGENQRRKETSNTRETEKSVKPERNYSKTKDTSETSKREKNQGKRKTKPKNSKTRETRGLEYAGFISNPIQQRWQKTGGQHWLEFCEMVLVLLLIFTAYSFLQASRHWRRPVRR